jgi:hypothetical protein
LKVGGKQEIKLNSKSPVEPDGNSIKKAFLVDGAAEDTEILNEN